MQHPVYNASAIARYILLLLAACLLCLSPALQASEKPNDHDALVGLKRGRVILDVRVPDVEKLIFNLELVKETWDGLRQQGVRPSMVVAFRGPGVALLSGPALDPDARELFKTLKARGVRFEVCAVAMRVFKVDPAGLIPEVKLVANVFNSFIGYQNKGYAMIAIN